ncbi:MAG TPA: metalloregulator ArsR/SmtB family transcription factor, partial [Acidimicrobiales bacterium]|nr:metalloregulator ArsR/SmtB family transcription factor [Acidimicrobiales bacterium]
AVVDAVSGGSCVPVLEDELSRTFSALADPTRRAMLRRLAVADATVNELAEPFALTQQAISRHVKVLEQVGLVSRTRAAQSRPCHLEPHRLDVAEAWISEQRQIWAERYDRLDQHLKTLQADPRGSTRRRD